MNLTVRAAINGMIGKSSELVGTMESKLERTQEVAEAIESLRDANSLASGVINMLDDLEVASKSLEACGYSDAWMNTINVDGRFLDAINLDAAALCGTDAEKTQVAMEGIWDTICEYVKKVWNFIVGIFNRIVNFIKKILGILRGDAHEVDKARGIVDLIMKSPDVSSEAMQLLGESINKIRSGKMFDMRGLITRMSVASSLAAFMSATLQETYGAQPKSGRDIDTGDGFYSLDFEAYAYNSVMTKNSPTANFGLKAVYETIENSPDKITSRYPFMGFRDFDQLNNSTGLKAAMTSSGISLGYNGPEIVFHINGLEDSVPEIDYKAIYRDISAYAKVLEVCTLINKSYERTCSSIQSSAQLVEELGKDAMKAADKQRGILSSMSALVNAKTDRKRYALTQQGKWILQEAGIITSLIDDTFIKCKLQMDKIVKACCDTNASIKKVIDAANAAH